MTISVRAPGAPGDDGRHRERLSAVREEGPCGLADDLLAERFLIADLVLDPAGMFDPVRHSPGAYVELLGRLHEVGTALAALEARTEVALAESTRVRRRAEAEAAAAYEGVPSAALERLDERAEKSAGREISMATRIAPSTAHRSLASSRRLVETMPEMLTALVSGEITTPTAFDAASQVSVLDPELRREVDRRLGELLPEMDSAGRGDWNQAIASAIEEVDPYGEAARHQRARQTRSVTVRRNQHGMATVTARMPAVDAVLMRKRLSLEAERLRALGDRRGHHAIMTDVMADTVLGRTEEMDPVTLELGLVITDRTLIVPAHGDAAHIEGYGPVPAEAVREQLRTALREPETPGQEIYGPDGPALRVVLRRLYVHPTKGELTAVESEARDFPRSLKRFLTLRDMTCRAPFCDAPVRQQDHIRAHADGGPTSIENGQGLCQHCNQKELHLRSVARAEGPGHQVQWTSHAGTQRITRPARLVAPSRGERAEDEPTPEELPRPEDPLSSTSTSTSTPEVAAETGVEKAPPSSPLPDEPPVSPQASRQPARPRRNPARGAASMRRSRGRGPTQDEEKEPP